jgi:hypothetical protein
MERAAETATEVVEVVAGDDYYSRTLGADRFGVVVRHIDDQHGKGCFAVAGFEERAVVFRDRSLACLQSRKQTPPPPAPPAGSSSGSGDVKPDSCGYPHHHYGRPVATCERCYRCADPPPEGKAIPRACVHSAYCLWRHAHGGCAGLGLPRFVGSLWLQLALLGCGKSVQLSVDHGAGGVLRAHLPSNADFTLPAIPPEESVLTNVVYTRQVSLSSACCDKVVICACRTLLERFS